MRSEQLFVSAAEVRVTYRFVNTGGQTVSNLVAFPMPDITIADQDTNIAVPTEDPANFLGFTTTANGEKVATRIEQKVFANSVEQTPLLQRLRVPLAPQAKATYDALDALPREKWQQLVDLGLAEIVEYGTTADMKMQQHLEPRWTLKTTYFWQQAFAGGQETLIEHRYKPSVGSSAGSVVGDPGQTDLGDYPKKYCMDAGFRAAAARAQRSAQADSAHGAHLGEQRIDYILKTGANWAGPIADFTLTVDKGKPDNLVSFCADGVKKVSPTRFEVHYTDFTPKSDLSVLILQTIKEQ